MLSQALPFHMHKFDWIYRYFLSNSEIVTLVEESIELILERLVLLML